MKQVFGRVPRLGLRARMVGALVLVGLLVLLVAVAFRLAEFRGPREVDKYFFLLAQYAGEGVRLELEQGATAVQTIAGDGIISSPGEERGAKEARLRYFQGLFPGFEDLTLVDGEGRVVASSQYSYRGEWAVREEFQRALAGEVVISRAYLLPGFPAPCVFFAAPVGEGKLRAVVAGQMSVVTVTALVGELKVGGGGRAFVVNDMGRILAYPLAGRFMEFWAPQGVTTPVVGETVREIRGAGTDYVYAVASLPVLGMLEEWRVVLQIPTAEAYAYVQRSQELILLVSLGILFLIGMVALTLGASVVRPVRKVAASARRLASGDLSQQVEASQPGELKELAEYFNTMAQELRAKIQALQESRRRLVTAQEGVRRDIAAQLHGPVQTKLFILGKQLEECQELFPSSPEQAGAIVTEVRQELDKLRDQELRPLSHRLYPAIIRMGLPAALRSLRDSFASVLGIELRIDDEIAELEDPAHPGLSSESRLALYRGAEEALNNVVKHSGAKVAKVKLHRGGSGAVVYLTVEDEGMGFKLGEVRHGLGLTSMQDYVGALGGNCVIDTAPEQGTRVTLTIPLTP